MHPRKLRTSIRIWRFCSIKQGQFDAAKTHSEEAIRAARTLGDKAGELGAIVPASTARHAARQMGETAERMLMQV